MKTNQIKNIQNSLPKSRFQGGLSMIELLIAMVIGLFLMGGLITNFVSTKKSDQTRNIISDMDANAQTAMNVLRQAISHAGYPSINNIELGKAFITKDDFPAGSSLATAINNPLCKDGVSRDSSAIYYKNRTSDHGIRDRLTVVSLADNPSSPNAHVYYDCTGGGMEKTSHDIACSTDHSVGMSDPRDAKVFSSFTVKYSAGIPTLYCNGSRGGEQPIANNVYAMQFLYGVRQQDTGTTIYKTASAIDTGVDGNSQWGLVNSIQIALLMRSEEKNVLPKRSAKLRYRLLNRYIYIRGHERRRMYKVYTTTVNVENINKAPLL